MSSGNFHTKNTVKLVLLSILLALGMLLQAIEALYLPPLMIPGAKMGIANMVTLLLILFFNWREVYTNVVLRVTTVALVTGTFLSTTFAYSLLAGFTSATIMLLSYRLFYGSLSFVGVSVLGAVTHNLTQLVLALVILGHLGVIAFLPWLIFMAVVSGLATGLVANLLVGPLLSFAEINGFGILKASDLGLKDSRQLRFTKGK